MQVEERFHELFRARPEGWTVESGRVLIAGPFLRGEHFCRSVIYMARHDEEGSVGFVLNKPLDILAGEVVGELAGLDLPLHAGGPVESSTLYYLHRHPGIPGSIPLPGGVYWGGDLAGLARVLREGEAPSRDARFFAGYCGWGAGQLRVEIAEHYSWLTGEIGAGEIFSLPAARLWEASMQALGGKFRLWATFPVDPGAN